MPAIRQPQVIRVPLDNPLDPNDWIVDPNTPIASVVFDNPTGAPIFFVFGQQNFFPIGTRDSWRMNDGNDCDGFMGGISLSLAVGIPGALLRVLVTYDVGPGLVSQ